MQKNNMSMEIEKELQKKADPKRAKASQWFFKTGPGEYGEGDTFIGITVPEQRKTAHKFLHLTLPDIQKLLKSFVHEYRFTALEILVAQYEKAKDEAIRKKIYDFYLKNIKYINNWDLVDTSAPYIVGHYCFHHNTDILVTLAQSKNIWERRIAIIATAYFIKQGKYIHTLKIAKILLNDSHDLIHKAVGWMLREVGNKSVETEEKFLKQYYKKMPRTMLRYAIEKFPKEVRAMYLAK
ncbi:MAG: putative alkylation repair enzyme [Candidatus Paceibacter sp.]|jgi:3-methyladenine DNA glycosylase AlkD|nr:putative alkylation repair enzyme [Candidatus Paceibacter sp.]